MQLRFIVESPRRSRRTLLTAMLAVGIAIPALSLSAAADEEQSAPLVIGADGGRTFGAAPGATSQSETTAPVIVADDARPFGRGPGAPPTSGTAAPVIIADDSRTFGAATSGGRTSDTTDGATPDSTEQDSGKGSPGTDSTR